MELSKLKKVPLSYLSFLSLDQSQNSFFQTCAKEELRRRLQNTSIPVEQWLNAEEMVFNERGYQVERYLFGPHPSMQHYMELVLGDGPRTFSELHLCPFVQSGDDGNAFYRRILKSEVKNLDVRMFRSVSPKEVERLRLVRKEIKDLILQDRPFPFEDDKFSLNSSLRYLRDLGKPFSYGANLSIEQQYHLASSPFGKLESSIFERIDDSMCDQENVQKYVGMARVLSDSSKMNEQRRMLLEQVRAGFEVDYQAKAFQKVLNSKK